MLPEADVYDLYAVPPDPEPLAGGQGGSVRAGDLVLSPGRSESTAVWLNPILARLATELDHERPRSIRLAMPIPTRDGCWVAHGWGATRFEPGTRPLGDLDALLATSRLLHARLASHVPTAPPGVRAIDDRYRAAERIAFGEEALDPRSPAVTGFVEPILDAIGDGDLGPDQLVHGDLAGNVLLDADGVPLVIDVAPYWRPTRWADAVCVLDAVLWHRAPSARLEEWSAGADRRAMLRAIAFRVLSDVEPDLTRYRRALGALEASGDTPPSPVGVTALGSAGRER